MKSTVKPNHLAEWRKHRTLTQEEVADRLHTSKATVSRLEGDKRGLSKKWLDRLGAIYDATPAELLGPPEAAEATAEDRSNRVPLIDSVRAGNWNDVTDPYSKGDARRWIPVLLKHGPRAFALVVDGPSMLPEYHDKDVIVVDPDVVPKPGDDVIAKQEDENTATFKRLRIKSYDSRGRPMIELVPLNPDWPVMTLKKGGRIVGVAVELVRSLRSSIRTSP